MSKKTYNGWMFGFGLLTVVFAIYQAAEPKPPAPNITITNTNSNTITNTKANDDLLNTQAVPAVPEPARAAVVVFDAHPAPAIPQPAMAPIVYPASVAVQSRRAPQVESTTRVSRSDSSNGMTFSLDTDAEQVSGKPLAVHQR